jgi:hypothetical protein
LRFIVAFAVLLVMIWVLLGIRTTLSTQQLLLRSWARMARMHSQQPLRASYLYLCLGHVILGVIVAFVVLLVVIWVLLGLRTTMSTQQLLLRSWSRMDTMHSQQPLDASYLYLCLGHVILGVIVAFVAVAAAEEAVSVVFLGERSACPVPRVQVV